MNKRGVTDETKKLSNSSGSDPSQDAQKQLCKMRADSTAADWRFVFISLHTNKISCWEDIEIVPTCNYRVRRCGIADENVTVPLQTNLFYRKIFEIGNGQLLETNTWRHRIIGKIFVFVNCQCTTLWIIFMPLRIRHCAEFNTFPFCFLKKIDVIITKDETYGVSHPS